MDQITAARILSRAFYEWDSKGRTMVVDSSGALRRLTSQVPLADFKIRTEALIGLGFRFHVSHPPKGARLV